MRISVLASESPTFQIFVFFALLAVAAAVSHLVCITPSFTFSSSLLVLRGSHGTADVEQQVCVDHYFPCVC